MRQPKWVLDRDRRSSWSSIEKEKSTRSICRRMKHGGPRSDRELAIREIFDQERQAKSMVPQLKGRLASIPSLERLRQSLLRLAKNVAYLRACHRKLYRKTDAHSPQFMTTSGTFTIIGTTTNPSPSYNPLYQGFLGIEVTQEEYVTKRLQEMEELLKEKTAELLKLAEIDEHKLAEIIPDYEIDCWLEPRE